MLRELEDKYFKPYFISLGIHFAIFLFVFLLFKDKENVKVFEISFVGSGYTQQSSKKTLGSSLYVPPKKLKEEDIFAKKNENTNSKEIKAENLPLNTNENSNGSTSGNSSGLNFNDSIGDGNFGEGGFYKLTEGPKIIGEFRPKYPISARRLGKEGKVKIGIKIDENGNMISFEVLESSGEEFTKSVIEELKKVKFLPAVINGKPVKSYGILPVRFEIKDI